MSYKTGQNIKCMLKKHKLDSMAKVAEKNNLKKLRLYTLPEEERCKVSLMKEVAFVRKGKLELEFEDKN